jgi:Transposase family tnp2
VSSITFSLSGNDIITETDRDNIRAFKLKMFGNVTRRTFDQMRRAFQHKLEIKSEYAMVRRIALLAGIETIQYDCCVNSHILFTGQYEHLESCPFCHEPRYTRDRKARRSWNYIPLIPRLKSFYENLAMIEKLSYRRRYEHDPAKIRDVFDSTHYRKLLGQNVVVDGIKRPYTYFCDGRDIAFGLSVDGFLLYKRRRNGPSATPIILQNYNLPPQIRTHLENLICLGIIHKPKDLGSFLVPFDEECAQLARGVKTFDASVEALFALHGYVILEHGDIVAIEEMLGLRGHNGYSPCRSCNIKGIRNITDQGKIYYVPLTTPDLQHQTRPSVDPWSLDLRTHESYLEAHAAIASAPSKASKESLSKRHGIRHFPLLNRVSSIDFAVSFPWEWLHIFCENVIPNLVDLWCGNFKGLDVGTEDYEIPPNVWKEIGMETANSVKHIPSSYVNVLPNIAKDRSHYTAETWAFWLIYVAPIVLKGRFKREKYYKHLCLLAKIMKTTLKFELSHVEIDELEEDIIKWVQCYEK